MMREFSPESRLEQLQLLDECSRIEAKFRSEIGRAVMQAECSFVNEPELGEGYLLLGVSEQDNQFSVTGVSNIDQLLGNLQANCREQFEQPVAVEASAALLDGKTVIVVFVPEQEPAAKPWTFNNASLRAVTDLDTLAASQVLKRLHHQLNLLTQSGAGPATHYRLTARAPLADELPLFSKSTSNTGELAENTGDLHAVTGNLHMDTGEIPPLLETLIHQLTPKARKEKLWPVIVWLCELRPYKAEQLAELLGGRQVTALKGSHLNPLREKEGLIAYSHPEVVNHPNQAYRVTPKGQIWLREQGIDINDSTKRT